MFSGPKDLNGPGSVLEMLTKKNDEAKQKESNEAAEVETEPESQDLSYLLDPHEFPEPVIEEKVYANICESLPSELLARLDKLDIKLSKTDQIYFMYGKSIKVYLSEEDLRTAARMEEGEIIDLNRTESWVKRSIEDRLYPNGLVKLVDGSTSEYTLSDVALTGEYTAKFEIKLVDEI